MSVLLTGALATVPAVMLAVEMLAVLTPRVPMSSVVTANPAASRYTDRDEGYVRNTSTVPVKLTNAPAADTFFKSRIEQKYGAESDATKYLSAISNVSKVLGNL